MNQLGPTQQVSILDNPRLHVEQRTLSEVKELKRVESLKAREFSLGEVCDELETENAEIDRDFQEIRDKIREDLDVINDLEIEDDGLLSFKDFQRLLLLINKRLLDVPSIR